MHLISFLHCFYSRTSPFLLADYNSTILSYLICGYINFCSSCRDAVINYLKQNRRFYSSQHQIKLCSSSKIKIIIMKFTFHWAYFYGYPGYTFKTLLCFCAIWESLIYLTSKPNTYSLILEYFLPLILQK